MNLNQIKHTRIQIKYDKEKPYVACDDCSVYSDNRFLVGWDEKCSSIRQVVKEALEKHNKELNELWTKTLLYIKDNGVIKYLQKNNLYKFFLNYDGEEMYELIGASELSDNKIQDCWKYLTEKIVALERNKQK